ncbi:phospholipase A2 inhibitor LNF1-like [Engystomops pustulosus]|uniref:phospholipase A2 inhibitor LNF1-like n=1 Tax=Engystomops pustulosus TaxID=76066 RepID=UPI003AFAFB36
MSNLPILVCLLAAVIPQGHSLNCTRCNNDTGLTCTGPLETCGSGLDVCLTRYHLKTDGATIKRRCGYSEFCNHSVSVTYESEREDMWSFCCREDNCNAPLPDSIFIVRPNGFRCPASSSNRSSSPQFMQCKGTETHCFHNIGATDSGKNVLFLGCGNNNFCSYLSLEETNAKCVKATRAATSNLSAAPTLHLLLLGLFSVYASEKIITFYM